AVDRMLQSGLSRALCPGHQTSTSFQRVVHAAAVSPPLGLPLTLATPASNSSWGAMPAGQETLALRDQSSRPGTAAPGYPSQSSWPGRPPGAGTRQVGPEEPARRNSRGELVSSTAHFVRSVFALGIAQVLSWVGAIVLAIVLPRYLGGATYLAKEIARAPARAGALTVNALAMRLPLSLLIAGVAMVAVSHAG